MGGSNAGAWVSMMRTSYLVGKKYGRLTVLNRSRDKVCSGGYPEPYWLCECICGERKIVRAYDLTKKNTLSCGCLKREKNSAAKSHGFACHRNGKQVHTLYSIWAGMIQRCHWKKHISWRYYGGKGISVCKRWRKFKNFLKDMAPRWRKGLTIDRLNSSRNYTPSNCKWSTWKEQNASGRRMRYVT